MSSRRILLVDDDDGIREVTRVSLEATMGWQGLTASSGHAALRRAGDEGSGAILPDGMMLALGDNQLDGTILPERQYSSEWDGAWNGATSSNENGWSAEFFIPWRQMAMPQRNESRNIGIYI